MGYIRHHAIIVTSGIDDLIELAHAKAKEIFEETVSPIVNSATNGYRSFMVGPDGSKEGWNTSDIGNHKRQQYVSWIESQAYNDGSNSLSYAELFYGDDDEECEIVKHN